MKILYASCRYDPFDRDAGSGVDFNMYEAFQQNGVELVTVGPYKDRTLPVREDLPERSPPFSREAHRSKFSEAYLHSCARIVDETAEGVMPDAIFDPQSHSIGLQPLEDPRDLQNRRHSFQHA